MMKSNLNIWYIAKYAVVPNLGPPTRQYFISKYLRKLGCRITLFSSYSTVVKINEAYDGFFKEYNNDGFKQVLFKGPVIDLGFNKKRIISWIIFEIRFLRYALSMKKEERPDLIIASSLPILSFISGVILRKIWGILLILEIRDIYPLTLTEFGRYKSSHPFIGILSLIEKLSYHHADGIISGLPKADKHIQNKIKKKFLFEWIPSGYDPDYFHFKKKERYSLKDMIPCSKFIVGYAGRIGHANAWKIMVETAGKLKNNENIHFVFIGNGSEYDLFKRETEKMDNVTLIPFLNRSELLQLLSHFDILINTWIECKIYQYGVSPNKWIDYMYVGKPILVYLNGDAKIIRDSKCGTIIKNGGADALSHEILNYSHLSEQKRDRIGKNGQRYLVNELNYLKITQKLLRFILKISNRS